MTKSNVSYIIEGLQSDRAIAEGIFQKKGDLDGTPIDAEDEAVDEDRWITIKGTHVLVDDDGNIKNDNLRDKIGSTMRSDYDLEKSRRNRIRQQAKKDDKKRAERFDKKFDKQKEVLNKKYGRKDMEPGMELMFDEDTLKSGEEAGYTRKEAQNEIKRMMKRGNRSLKKRLGSFGSELAAKPADQEVTDKDKAAFMRKLGDSLKTGSLDWSSDDYASASLRHQLYNVGTVADLKAFMSNLEDNGGLSYKGMNGDPKKAAWRD